MIELFGFLASLGIGLSLGLIGGGGSILTVPVLVYLFHLDPLLATSYSLFIVGSSSAVGAVPYFRQQLIDFRSAVYFGIPSIISVFLTRHYILDLIPEQLVQLGEFTLSKDMAIMLLFAVLMFFAALKMIGKHVSKPVDSGNNYLLPFILQGTGVGLISGLIGAGGGFLIIPALIIFNGMPMKTAIGTSLLIIAANSLFGFIGNLDLQRIDWTFLLSITGIAMVGILLGSKLSQRIDGKKLKPIFGWFVLLMAFVIIVQELN
ncbi:sulfite exporter TauE/SafE family protein [Sphingobacterium lactis]|uniref:sulfite exporter TauE/SafE family protein n=1 Tax=Sphingobacterium lactis TaxID=797291 RepID=UPI003DA3C671